MLALHRAVLFVQRDKAAPVAIAGGRCPPLLTSFIASAFAGQADAEEIGKITRFRGDMAGGLSVLGDVYKTQVYALAKYINKKEEIIPNHILTKAPSAELRPNQKDSDSLPEYDELDNILFKYIEERQGPRALIAQGFDENLVNRILRIVNLNEYKRNQFCPIIRVSYKAFGVGRRLPIVAKYLS